MRLVVERGGRLGSGVEAWDGIVPDVQVIFRAYEVHMPEYSPGAKFR
ncbi:MAG: hypothetical protein LC797_03290 [Chloroflexi bacterium]|nr:hypothetical protein [Chloroflexota bacterium]